MTEAATGTVDLAHTPELRIGRLIVRPPLRQVAREDGAEEVLEPRVMQVLVALGRAPGTIVARDDLTAWCWEGRVVGEDAINRVISRLRRVAEGIGAGSFRIETVTKVGYRLIEEAGAGPTPAAPTGTPRISRRWLIGGGTLAAAGAATGLYFVNRGGDDAGEAAPPADVAQLMFQANILAQQGTPDGASQAIGLLRRVVSIRPDYADGWGLLALAYAGASRGGAPHREADSRQRAQEAMARAESLQPTNLYAKVARIALMPSRGNWARAERTLIEARRRYPESPMLMGNLSGLWASVGRCREAADLSEQLVGRTPLTPGATYPRVQILWAAGRLDQADRAMAEAWSLFPSQFAVWFTRYYLLLYTGRAAEALAMSANRDGRPSGISESNFAMIDAVARAMQSRSAADIDTAVALNLDGARTGSGFAENAIQFASALDRIDAAFAVADAYYFGRGFRVPDQRFPERATFTRADDRNTRILFLPSTARMRGDPRFARLVGELGLERYWREMNVQPDYRRG